MKKYWILIVISVVMIASVGTFYIQSAFATNNMPEFTIEKIKGDEKEVESLVMTGFYYDELTYIGEEFEFDLEGIKYRGDKSFLERMDISYHSPRIKQLQKDYRNFMRGKYGGINTYFENEEVLAYADVSYKNPYTVSSEFEFHVAVLDKQTNKITSFDHLVPNSGDFWNLYPVKVQVIDDQLKVITRNDMREENRLEVHLYTFDVAKQTLINDEVILSTKDAEDQWINIETLDADDPMAESKYVVFNQQTFAMMESEDEGFMEEVVEEELIIYDLSSDTSKAINLESLTEHGYPEHLDGSNIYLTRIGEDGILKITVFDIESEQIINGFDIELLNSSERQNRKFNNGKLYVVNSNQDIETANSVTVVNLENGETLFEGEIKRKEQKDTIKQIELDIHEILLK